MKYRAEAVGLVVNDRPVGTYSDSLEVVNHWAHLISKKHDCEVKIYQSYEQVLTTVHKPYNGKRKTMPL